MKGIKAFLISLFVVLALIAINTSVSANNQGPPDHNITDGNVVCLGDTTIWTYTVNNNPPPAISNWVVFWCNSDVIDEVKVDDSTIKDCDSWNEGDEDWCYEYKTDPDPNLDLKGIKIEYKGSGDSPSGEIHVTIKLSGCGYGESNDVAYGIKAGNVQNNIYGTIEGPLACDPWIPEFSTIAIPVAMILGLLLFFNHRKRREE